MVLKQLAGVLFYTAHLGPRLWEFLAGLLRLFFKPVGCCNGSYCCHKNWYPTRGSIALYLSADATTSSLVDAAGQLQQDLERILTLALKGLLKQCTPLFWQNWLPRTKHGLDNGESLDQHAAC